MPAGRLEHGPSAAYTHPVYTHSTPGVLRPTRFASLLILGLALTVASDAQDEAEGTLVSDGKIWSLVTSGEPLAWSDANAFCETLEVAGRTDWRLPRLVELEALRDPSAASGLPEPLALDDCCAWSSENLVDIAAEPKGDLPPPGGRPEQYYWGYLFASGVSYYSNLRFPDGAALCVRDAAD